MRSLFGFFFMATCGLTFTPGASLLTGEVCSFVTLFSNLEVKGAGASGVTYAALYYDDAFPLIGPDSPASRLRPTSDSQHSPL